MEVQIGREGACPTVRGQTRQSSPSQQGIGEIDMNSVERELRMRAELFQEAVARSLVLSVVRVDHDAWHMHEHSELVEQFSLCNMNE